MQDNVVKGEINANTFLMQHKLSLRLHIKHFMLQTAMVTGQCLIAFCYEFECYISIPRIVNICLKH